MSESLTGISTVNADAYVATKSAAEVIGGKTGVIQLIGLTAGKIDQSVGSPLRTVSTSDSFDVTTFSGSVLIYDDSFLACYIEHSQLNGSCLVTPLLCDNGGVVIGCLPSRQSQVNLPLQKGSYYISNCLSWDIKDTGAWKGFIHISNLSSSNTVKLWSFTL